MNRANWIMLTACIILAGCLSSIDNSQIPQVYLIEGQIDTFGISDPVIIGTFDPVTQITHNLDTGNIDETGRFSLDYPFTQPDLFRLLLPGRQSAILAIDSGDDQIEVKAEGKRNGNFELTGSEAAQKLLAYEAFRKESNERLIQPPYDAMREATKQGNTQGEIAAVDAYVKASAVHRQELIDYAKKHLAGSIALYGSMLRWTSEDRLTVLQGLVDDFAEKYPNLEMTKVMQAKLDRYKAVAIGQPAPHLVASDTAGVEVRLEDLRGTVTLIDFWASWCRPCLLQIPDLKNAHADYGDRGFQIVGVSVDRNAKSWKKAIQRYAMDWPHMSDASGWDSALSAAYNVTFIPFNVVIDSDGKIIAKNVHDEELRLLLDEQLSGS